MNEKMVIIPINLKQANEFVLAHHRHNTKVVGCKFCIGLWANNKLCGVAIVGRPVSRVLDNGFTCEINRLCTNGITNGCSKLYGACCRIAREMGYKKIITYILKSENGASLKASNFMYCGIAGGVKWTGKRYTNKTQKVPHEMKQRYEKIL